MTDLFSNQTIIHGDCLEVMRGMEPNSIDCILTDSPYGLSFMGKHWDKGIPGKEFWIEALRVCKPGAMMLAFGGTRTYHRLACAIEDAGWEIRDCLMWLYGSGFPKGKSCLKPAYEPIILCRKKGNIQNLNIDKCRIKIKESLKRPTGINQSIFGLKKYDGNDPKGRWPANLLFDEEAAKMLDEQSGISKSPYGNIKGTRSSGGILNRCEGNRLSESGHGDSGGASRFFKCIESECFLCYNPCTKAQDKECKNIHAMNVNQNSITTLPTIENIAQKNVQIIREEQLAQNVKSAEILCDLCAMNIAQGLVKIKNSDFKIEELQATLGYIGNYKSSILIPSLVFFAELWESIDIIPTTQSLSLLFGSVRHAIENCINQENLNLSGNSEQLRFRYQAKASPSERNGSTHPTMKPIKLLEYLLKLIMPPSQNAIVLDPFAGSGSTLVAAKNLGFNAIGIEIEAEYVEIAKCRIG